MSCLSKVYSSIGEQDDSQGNSMINTDMIETLEGCESFEGSHSEDQNEEDIFPLKIPEFAEVGAREEGKGLRYNDGKGVLPVRAGIDLEAEEESETEGQEGEDRGVVAEEADGGEEALQPGEFGGEAEGAGQPKRAEGEAHSEDTEAKPQEIWDFRFHFSLFQTVSRLSNWLQPDILHQALAGLFC